MASTSKGSASLLPKVIFWLLIVIIGFSYMRSLARYPGTDTPAEKADTVAPVVSEIPASAATEAAEPMAAGSAEMEPLSAVADKTPDSSYAVVEPAPTEPAPDLVEPPQAMPATDAPVSSAEVNETNAAEQSKPEPASTALPYSQTRSESATQVLSEFDEMRKAAEAERKAMYEMMRKQREMREPMMPSSAFPRWQSPGYPTYNPYPQGYYPYAYPQK